MMRKQILLLFMVIIIAATGVSRVNAQEEIFIKNWLICGPFGESNLDTEIISEENALVPKAGDYTSGKLWRKYAFVKEKMDLEEKPAFGYQDMAVGYAYVEIESSKDGWLGLYLGSDDGVKVWWNGQLVIRHEVARAVNIDEDKIHLRLHKGANRLLFKINDLFGGWGFSAKLVGLLGTSLEDITLQPTAEAVVRLPLQKVRASTVQGGDLQQFDPLFSIDEDMQTRWSGEHYTPQWYEIVFLKPYSVARVDVYWENAYASQYRLDITKDGKNWLPIHTQLEGDGGHEIIILDKVQEASALRLYAKEKATDWGTSFWELEVYGFAKEPVDYSEALENVVSELAQSLPIKSVTASSEQPPNRAKNESFEPINVIDNDLRTRWSSTFEDPQWIMIDLGSIRRLQQINLLWETAMASDYSVETSKDALVWETVYSVENEKEQNRIIFFQTPVEAQYIRVNGTKRKTTWGYSLWELQVFGAE
ncbi:MAG: discoidin domain-containing protein [Chlamydiota bacterium]|nr:discoidin domain-containing protein [Chlamydiota bacterium]